MKEKSKEELAAAAVAGDQAALEAVLCGAQDLAFNLALRMLGTVPDAEDATQEILLKVMTHLSSFRGESSLDTWVFRIAVNHLRDYRKGMFAGRPLSFEAYGEDIASGRERDVPDLSAGVDRTLLEQELKLSCTNVMLQCLDAETRCIYVLGTMFRLDSRLAAEILEMTPEAYRQRLSRARAKMAQFLRQYCGLSGTGPCRCRRRVDYAIASRRIDPAGLRYRGLTPCGYETLASFTAAMEQLDALSQVFADFPAYRAPEEMSAWVRQLLASPHFDAVKHGGEVG